MEIFALGIITRDTRFLLDSGPDFCMYDSYIESADGSWLNEQLHPQILCEYHNLSISSTQQCFGVGRNTE